MKRFRFKLEAPLKYRQGRRDQCRQLLAELLADERERVQRRESLENQRTALLGELRDMSQSGSLDIDRAAARRFFAGHLTAEIGVALRDQQVVEQQIALCRQALRRAEQEVQSLEKMRERHLDEFRYQQDRAEARELEETWMATSLSRAAR